MRHIMQCTGLCLTYFTAAASYTSKNTQNRPQNLKVKSVPRKDSLPCVGDEVVDGNLALLTIANVFQASCWF